MWNLVLSENIYAILIRIHMFPLDTTLGIAFVASWLSFDLLLKSSCQSKTLYRKKLTLYLQNRARQILSHGGQRPGYIYCIE